MDQSHADLQEAERRLPAVPRRLRIAVLGAFGASGAASLIYEVAWQRQLSMVFSSTVYALSIMLASFMTGLALGGWLGGKWADKRRLGSFHLETHNPMHDGLSDLSIIEFGIGALGLASVLVVQLLPRIQYAFLTRFELPPLTLFVFQMLLAFLVMLPPTTLMGATLPLASKAVVRSYSSLGSTLGLLYSFNTVGAVAGSLLAGFVLIPLVGVRATVVSAACVNLTASVILLAFAKRTMAKRVISASLVIAVLAVAIVALPESAFPLSFGVAGRYNSYSEYRVEANNMKVLFDEENAYSRVAVLETDYGKRVLVNGSLTEGSDSVVDRATTSALSVLPFAYATNPRTSLIIGLGTGITTQAMLSLPVESATTVEINPAVRTAAVFFVGEETLRDERLRLVIDDARGYLQDHPERYDLITSEPSWPLASAVSPLFTQEFYEVASSRLEDGGVFCQWAPQYLLVQEDFETLYRTFNSVFPYSQVWWLTDDGQPTGDLFIVGVKNGSAASQEVVRQTADRLMEERGLGSVALEPAPYGEILEAAIEDTGGGLNTDNRPVLEFHIPWELARSTSQVLGVD